jgi:hypothetical protein
MNNEEQVPIHSGVVYEIDYTDPNVGSRREQGTISSLNTQGFLILNKGGGIVVMIERSRVFRIVPIGSTL